MNVLALDLALTTTGYAGPSGSGTFSPPTEADRGMARLAWIRDEVLFLAEGTDLVVLEGYSFASRGRQHATGELGGVVRLALWERAVPVVEVPPSSLKKYATGKGNSGKDQVLAAAIRRLGFKGHDHNEADALWLLAMTRDHYGLPDVPSVPKAHRSALDGVEWPELAQAPVSAPEEHTGATGPALNLFEHTEAVS